MSVRYAGFTLMEFMTALAIIAVLVGLGVPTFREFTRNSAAAAAHGDLVTALNLARSESMRLGRTVSLCASTDGLDCSGDADDWQAGWLTFVDESIPGVVDNDDEPLQFWRGPRGDVRVAPAADPFIQYRPDGLTSAVAPQVFEIDWPGCTGDRTRRVVVSVIGSVSTTKVNCT